jgi:signal transduction histidine kinase
MTLVATITLGLACFALGTAAFNLWIFWMRPREPAHLWLGVASIGVVWLSAGFAATYEARTLAEAQNAALLAIGGALPLVTGFIRFSELFAGIRHPALRLSIVLTALATLWICAEPASMFDGSLNTAAPAFGGPALRVGLSPVALAVYAGFACMIVGLVVGYARRARALAGGRSITLSLGVWGACMLNDMCVGLGFYAAPWLLPFGFVAFSGTFSSLLLRKLVRSQRHLERSASELRVLIEARTGELRRKDLELAHGARLATLGALAGGIAQEIERPLAEIDANVKELRVAWHDPARRAEFAELLARSTRGVEQIRGVVAELLQLARREQGHQGLHELPAVVAGVLPVAGYELRRRAQLETHLMSTPPVRGDAAMLAQIALNLLVGAIHAFPEDPPLAGARIELATEERDGQACLVVADNVPAPPNEAAIDLFEDSAASDAERERRLQLAVTKQLVERHGGSLEVEAGLHGTRVAARFPAALGAEAAA